MFCDLTTWLWIVNFMDGSIIPEGKMLDTSFRPCSEFLAHVQSSKS